MPRAGPRGAGHAAQARDSEHPVPRRGALVGAGGPDGGGTWREGPAALGQLIAHRSPGAAHAAGPVVVAGGRVVVAAAGRLDNRIELASTLDAAPATADGSLMALAYERWGEDAVRRLVLARDHYGETALYHHYDGSTFAFASSLKGLLALPHVRRRPNELRFAAHRPISAAKPKARFRFPVLLPL